VHHLSLFLIAFALATSPTPAAAQTSSEDPVIELEAINPSLGPLTDPPNLETPQACIENFIFSSRDDDFGRAARSLNFRLLDDVSEDQAAAAAERLYFVIDQELWIDWEAIPDRSDGMLDRDTLGSSDPMAGRARRGLRLGSIDVDGRDVPIRLQRVRAPDADPIWLFSAHTVENIDLLYQAHGPGWLERRMPEWSRARWWGGVLVWKWVVIGLTLVLAPVIGALVTMLARRLLVRVLPNGRKMGAKFDWPIAAVVTTLIILVVVEGGLSLPNPIAGIADPLALIAVVAAFAWLAMRALGVAIDRLAKDAVRRLHDEDSSAQRRVLTQITVARHALMLIVALIALGIVMLQLDTFRTFGMAVLSSAGAAAVILGLAGHAVLGNLIAGLQIALTQPFTLGDTVLIEGNWGKIEDIAYTYVVVRTWDERRLIFPIKYFIGNWFENWSMADTFQKQAIYLHVDYRADVQKIRDKFLALVEEDEDWARDRDEPEALVTETGDETMTVRLTCAGASPSEAWSLHCRVREKLIAWLQQVEEGAYLPSRRVIVTGNARSGSKPSDEHRSS